jgi:hypothetical protein
LTALQSKMTTTTSRVNSSASKLQPPYKYVIRYGDWNGRGCNSIVLSFKHPLPGRVHRA